MKKKLSPREKKNLSLQKDCRNQYGENDKSSRKNIARNKSLVNRSYRRATKQACSDFDEDLTEDELKLIQRSSWHKWQDSKLEDVLKFKKLKQFIHYCELLPDEEKLKTKMLAEGIHPLSISDIFSNVKKFRNCEFARVLDFDPKLIDKAINCCKMILKKIV